MFRCFCTIFRENLLVQIINNKNSLIFYRCTVHFENVKIPFYQQMHLLLYI